MEQQNSAEGDGHVWQGFSLAGAPWDLKAVWGGKVTVWKVKRWVCQSWRKRGKPKPNETKLLPHSQFAVIFCCAFSGENVCRKLNIAVKFPEDFCLSAASFSLAFWKALEEKLYTKWIVQDSHLSFQYCLALISEFFLDHNKPIRNQIWEADYFEF